MLTIEEVERILAEHPFLPKPRYVYMVKSKVVGFVPDGLVVEFKGVTPRFARDRIALTVDADDVTVVHECLHLAGFGEPGAYALAGVVRRFRKLFPPLVKREVKYRLVATPREFVEVYERVV